jgi:hypothetical protein
MEAIIAVAVMAWNIALFPDEEHAHVQGMLLESLPPQLSGEDVGVLVSTMDTLIARKRLLYPQVREYILTHQLSLVGNKVTLSVGTAPVPETRLFAMFEARPKSCRSRPLYASAGCVHFVDHTPSAESA